MVADRSPAAELGRRRLGDAQLALARSEVTRAGALAALPHVRAVNPSPFGNVEIEGGHSGARSPTGRSRSPRA